MHVLFSDIGFNGLSPPFSVIFKPGFETVLYLIDYKNKRTAGFWGCILNCFIVQLDPQSCGIRRRYLSNLF